MPLPPDAKRLVLKSQREEADQAIADILANIEASESFENTSIFAIRLALEEALTNAIHHGNNDDASKSIIVDYFVDHDRVMIEVEDEGPGFNPEAVPDPTQEENIAIPSGRGLMLMHAYMTNVDFNETGNRIRMHYYKPEAD